MYNIGWDIGIQLRFGKRESTRPRENGRAPLMLNYFAGDGKAFWMLALEGDRHWPALVAAVDSARLRVEHFASAKLRLANNTELIATLDELFAERPMAEWAERFDAHDVWWAPLNSIPEVIADPQARAAGAFVAMSPRDGEAPYEAVNNPVDFDGYTLRPGPVPRLGEHTNDYLA
jgi:crotonobetainyl-CoA:carnitine CoA-transferase CaiB-like acyl-CoA transferase